MNSSLSKSSLVVAILTLSVQTFAANPVVSDTALSYSADQSVQPIATHTPLKVSGTPIAHQPIIMHSPKKSKVHKPKHNIHHYTHQKSQ